MFKLSGRVFCTALLAGALSVACTESASAPADDDVWVVLMAGQSNMAGAGGFKNLSPDMQRSVKDAASRVRLVNKGAKPAPLAAEYSKYQEDKRGLSYVFGPELIMSAQFAKAYPERKFLIIKTAHGGTSLYGAWSPDWSKDKAVLSEKGEYKQNLPLYANFLTQTQEALAQLEAGGETYEIKGFGWFQGEADGNRELTAKAYKDLMPKFIAAYRKDLSAPDLPFVLGQVNNSGRRYKAGPPVVRQAIAETAAADMRVTMIATSTDKSWSDYPKHDDNVHYNTDGQKRLGQAYADAFIEFWGGADAK